MKTEEKVLSVDEFLAAEKQDAEKKQAVFLALLDAVDDESMVSCHALGICLSRQPM